MPIVTTKTKRVPAPEPDDSGAVCEVDSCGADAHTYEVNGDTVPLYLCGRHRRNAAPTQTTWEGYDDRD